MPEQKYDCIVIGSGPGGYVAAIRAAQLGMKTAVVEKNNVGGRCLNEACIPAKAMLRVAEVFQETQHAGDFGIKVEGASVEFDGATKHRDKVIKTLTSGVAMLFDKNKIDYIEGFGSVTEPKPSIRSTLFFSSSMPTPLVRILITLSRCFVAPL